MNSILETPILKVKLWGEQQLLINYILQTDLTNQKEVKNYSTLNFFIAAKNRKILINETNWLDKFGTATRKHAADHGFCAYAKATYENGFQLHFVIVSIDKNKLGSAYYNIQNLENSKKLLVNNQGF